MYLYNVYNEVDLEYLYKSTLFRVNMLKTNNLFIYKPKIVFYFFFNKVSDPELERIYENLFIVWFFSKHKFKVSKIKTKLIRGFRYYWFNLSLNFNINNFFKFFEVFNFSLLPFLGDKNVLNYYNYNNFWYYISNIRGFNNIRLLDYFYLTGIYKELLIHIFSNSYSFFKSSFYFLSLFKGVKS